jgi:serpin B
MQRTSLICVLFLLGAQALLAEVTVDPAALSVNQLGLGLLRQQSPGKNAVLSPYSVDDALAMAWEGARGETREQMAQVLGYPKVDGSAPLASLSKEVAKISSQRQRFMEPELKASELPRLDIACRIFAQKGFAIQPSYLDLMRKDYGSPLELVDFAANPEGAAETINAWVADSTKNRIDKLVSSEDVAGASLVLANAIYFKACWQKAFDKGSTKPRSFHLADGESIAVPTMTEQTEVGYRRGKGYTVVSLGYEVSRLMFLIILPDDPAGLSKLENEIDAKTLIELSRIEGRECIIRLPKFKLEPPTLQLSDALKKLGLANVFGSKGNFDGIAPGLFISQVLHKAFISVDENGTEAAAATAMVGFGAAPVAQIPTVVRIDHPFLFAVQDIETGACLFLGRVTDPR